MHRIVVSNQKGGIGKTTLCINLSACLAKKGYKVLLVDLDRQGHSTLGLGVSTSESNTVAELLSFDDCAPEEVITETYIKGLDIIPSDITLSAAEHKISQLEGREFILREKLKNVEYDYLIIDTSPSFSVLLTNAFLLAEHLIIPMNLHFFTLAGINALLDSVNKTNKRVGSLVGHKLKVLGVVLNMFKTNTLISKHILESLDCIFQDYVLKNRIRECVKIMEAQKNGLSILDYDPKNPSSEIFINVTEEIIGRLESV
jgi:chromosome partitioning protein